MKMKRTLYLKFLAAYMIFGVLALIVIATLTSNMTLKHLTKVQAGSLYREAQLVASSYALRIYSNDESGKEAAKSQLKAIDTYISANIWVINNSSKVLFDSDRKSVV